MSCEVLSTHTPALFRAAVDHAVARLKLGEVVGLPTETVYGLAANALSTEAVSQIYKIKGRPAHNPIIVHVADIAMARTCVQEWTGSAARLARAFWPGPLTMVLPRSSLIPDIVTADGETVGIRWPGHPFMQQVIRACGFPLAAPSANRSNEISPTNAEHVRRSLGDQLKLIVDGGQSQVGIESTVVDLTGDIPRILRPGMIHEESLLATLGQLREPSRDESGPLRSPGQLPRHYAPKGTLTVFAWDSTENLLAQTGTAGIDPVRTTVICHTHIPSPEGWMSIHVIPHDAEAYARALYAELHRCDEDGARWIIIEAVPETAEWKGISDRLRRAATPT
jgi:L-threonylcarbamoyladenylate synthase